MDTLSKKRTCWWFVVKRKNVLENFHEVWDNLSAVSVTCFAGYFNGRGENRDIKLACKTNCWRLWDRLRLQNKLTNWKSALWKKKKEQLNKDKCKLPCRQKCFSKHRMWDYWVNQWSYDFLHPAQMWPCNDTEPMEKSHPEKWLFRGWGGGVDISHYVAIGLKVCDFKTSKLLTLQLACRWTQLHHWYSMQQEMPKVLDWYR